MRRALQKFRADELSGACRDRPPLHIPAPLPHTRCLRVLRDGSTLCGNRPSRHGARAAMMDTLLLLGLNGLDWGIIIALIALGHSVMFGLLDIINIAHAVCFMLGTDL